MTLRHHLLVAAFLIGSLPDAHGLKPDQMTTEELRALPRWCSFTQTFERNPRAPGHYDDHLARYGPGWTHVHHYCWALGSMLRYSQFSTSAQMKRSLATSAIADIDYVLRNAPEDFVLRNEIVTRKARILIIAGSPGEGLSIAEQVAKEWPDQADSHGLVAEALLALKRRGDAKKVLDEAESRVKDNDRLARIRSALKL
jgi:hypothetical protein